MTPAIHAQAILRNICSMMDNGDPIDEKRDYIDNQCSKLVGYGALSILRRVAIQSDNSCDFMERLPRQLANEIILDCATSLHISATSRTKQRTSDVILGSEPEKLNFKNKRMQLASSLLKATGDADEFNRVVSQAQKLVSAREAGASPLDTLETLIASKKEEHSLAMANNASNTRSAMRVM